MTATSVIIQSDGETLEGVLHEATQPAARCVVAHPHPQFGGSMDNNAVLALCNALPEAGISALRFNFRSVGRSTGKFNGGIKEAFDVAAAIKFCRHDFSGPVFVAAYSFGAFVTWNVKQADRHWDGAALVSPPVNMFDMDLTYPQGAPLFVVVGDRDMFCDLRVLNLLMPKDNEPRIIEGADHFWGGYENEMAATVRDYFLSIMGKQ